MGSGSGMNAVRRPTIFQQHRAALTTIARRCGPIRREDCRVEGKFAWEPPDVIWVRDGEKNIALFAVITEAPDNRARDSAAALRLAREYHAAINRAMEEFWRIIRRKP